jgi:hypothetical protein
MLVCELPELFRDVFAEAGEGVARHFGVGIVVFGNFR